MPTYELALLLRTMPKAETATVLKRVANAIFSKGGLIRKIDNLGHMDTPYRISNHGAVYRQASYFVLQFDTPPNSLMDLREEYERDIDIVRRRIYKVETEKKIECTLAEELKPPPYRLEVQQMIEEGKKKEELKNKKKFKYNSGFDYYPFQK